MTGAPTLTDARFRLACDVGGTFTDFVLLDERDGVVYAGKQLTTPHDPAQAVIEGAAELLDRVPGARAALRDVVHGSTLANNLVLERKGAVTGLLTTRGFRDVLEIRHEERYSMFDLQLDVPEPLVPRGRRLEVRERMDSRGVVLQPLDDAGVDAAVTTLRAAGVQSVAVCFLHSYQNPNHELRTAARIREIAPELSVSISSAVLPEIREYERTSTTVIDAYVKPLISTYLSHLATRLRELGIERVYVMLSGGGIAGIDVARAHPVRLIESGPAAGVLAARYYAQLFDLDECLSFDIGGTTAKVGLVRSGEVRKSAGYEVDRIRRLAKGSGLPVQIPAIDLLEVGSGGGSIARLDGVGLLEVGPESAGAAPGPACYDRGGVEPTVTDADLLLGYLNPDYFLGSRMRLSVAAASAAIARRIAVPLGIDVNAAARGIHDLMNERMAAAIRAYCQEQGDDASRLTLIAFGGAGPVHAFGVAQKLGIKKVIVPPAAGIMSAVGLLAAPQTFDVVQTFKVSLHELTRARLDQLVDSLLADAQDVLAADGAATARLEAATADMRYVGQGFEINVPLPMGVASAEAGSLEAVRRAFDETYGRLYGHHYPELEVEIVSVRVTAALPSVPLQPIRRERTSVGEPLKGYREVYFPAHPKPVPAAVYERAGLAPGTRLRGPAVVEEPESTTVVGVGCEFEIDEYGGLVITLA